VKAIPFFLYQLLLSLWVGGMTAMAFVVAPPLFKTMGKDRASEVTSVLFPVFFNYQILLIALALVVFIYLAKSSLTTQRLGLGILILALALALYQALVLLPQAEHLRELIGSFETTAKSNPNRQAFGKLHGISSSINLLLLLGGLIQLYLSPKLQQEK